MFDRPEHIASCLAQINFNPEVYIYIFIYCYLIKKSTVPHRLTASDEINHEFVSHLYDCDTIIYTIKPCIILYSIILPPRRVHHIRNDNIITYCVSAYNPNELLTYIIIIITVVNCVILFPNS